jgi:hypothetical protein
VNAVEIEEAISALAEQPFDADEFAFAFLEAFGNKATTIKRLRTGASNKSDVGGVLQTNNIHIKIAEDGQVAEALTELKASPATTKARTKFVLATDGKDFQAEDLNSGEVIVCDYAEFPDHFGFFLPLAGISTVKQVRESAFDVKATGRLNRLYVELLKDNPEWGTAERRHDMNHFMARLIFCFFAEDTDIFAKSDMFTATIEQMSEKDSSNTHEIISELFRAMNTKIEDRDSEKIARWANAFPYVNGGLFSESVEVPRFSRIARSYLLHIGNLDWKKINPDIFGSMIQAVADDEERGALGMHYTSVPNILKGLNPLFLDDLRETLEEAGDNSRKLLNLRNRMAKIRVFDPACGSGNFLVIAYKEMRAIEAEINERRGEKDRKSDIPLTNFRGIELRDFPAEIARLALIIAEYQCDVSYRGQREALRDFLPLDAMNWITCGNALRLDWPSICPPTGTGVKIHGEDLFSTPLDQAEIDFENEGGETYICGNPPYIGTKYQTKKDKSDLTRVFADVSIKVGNADYVLGWLKKASEIVCNQESTSFAFVTTNSIFEGEQAEIFLWLLDEYGLDIQHAHTAFKWSNNATNNAGVTCCICQVVAQPISGKRTISDGVNLRVAENIGPYLVEMPRLVVRKASKPISGVREMSYGSMSNDSNFFTLSETRYSEALSRNPRNQKLLRLSVGGAEFVRGLVRRTLYIPPSYKLDEDQKRYFSDIFAAVREYRAASKRDATAKLASVPHLYAEPRHTDGTRVFVPQILSERREYVTAGLLGNMELAIAPHMQIVDGGPLELSLISSRLHLVWVSTICGKLETRLRYSNTLGWNTFPLPKLTEKNQADLARCGEDILLAREAHFPATIADLYDPEAMPDDLRAAHDRNDEVLERIYIGRRFKNDTERLEKLFELYTKITTQKGETEKKKVKAS